MRTSERGSVIKSYFIAWYNVGDKDDYEILQASSLDEAIDLAKASYGNDLEDVQPYEP